jgi:hypothetical protein
LLETNPLVPIFVGAESTAAGSGAATEVVEDVHVTIAAKKINSSFTG